MNQQTQNMTEGRPFRILFTFFIPIFLGNLFQQAYSMVDSVIVGRGIGDKALAAVGSTGLIHFLIMGIIFGLTGGFGIHMSQSFGAGNFCKLRKQIFAGIILSVLFGFLAILLCPFILNPIFRLINTPADIMEDAIAYFEIILYGLMISLLANMTFTILRSVGNSKTPLWATIIASVCNIVLDFIMVIPLHMGVRGAALATLISQIVSMLVCLRTIFRIDVLKFTREDFHYDSTHANEMLRTGVPVAIMNGITAGGCLVLQTLVNRMGSDYVASYAACMKIMGLFEQTSIAVGTTMLTYVGQNLGAGRLDRIRDGVKQGLILATLMNIPFAAAEIFFPKQLVGIMLTGAAPIAYSAVMLPISGFGLFGLGYLYVYRSSLQGLGDTVLPMFSGLVEVIMRFSFGLTIGVLSYRGIAFSEIFAWIGAWLFLMASFYYRMRKLARNMRTV